PDLALRRECGRDDVGGNVNEIGLWAVRDRCPRVSAGGSREDDDRLIPEGGEHAAALEPFEELLRTERDESIADRERLRLGRLHPRLLRDRLFVDANQ